MVDNDAPVAWPIWALGTRLTGFMKGITKHCYTENIKALGLMVSETKMFYVFPIITLWELSVAMKSRVPVQSCPKPDAVNPLLPPPRHGQFGPPGTWLAGFIKGITKHCYTQNKKLWVSLFQRRRLFLCFFPL